MDYIDTKATIGGVVAEIPKAAGIFSEVGIDYCCGGHRLLVDVMAEQGIDKTKVYSKLEAAVQERKSSYQNYESDFKQMSPAVLSAYIEDTHHGYLRHALPEAAELLNTILRVHGKNHTELFKIYSLFGQLKSELEQHLLKEETMLFPELNADESNRDEIIKLTDEIITEHEAAGEILRKLRSLAGNYLAPTDACNTYQKAYKLLEEIEKDLHQHIHLENNILFKDYSNR